MKDKFFKNVKLIDSRIEFISSVLAFIGAILYLIDNKFFNIFLIIGSVTLIILYILRVFIPNRHKNVSSVMVRFIDKVVYESLAVIIIGIMMILLGKKGIVFFNVGVFSLVFALLLMTYNKVKLKSKYVWGQKYFLRIAIIIGMSSILFIKMKGIIDIDF